MSLDSSTIVTQLQSLPGITTDGNHTLSIRGLAANDSGGHSSTSNIAVNVMLMDTANANNVQTASSGGGISAGVISALVVVVLGLGLGAVLLVARNGQDAGEKGEAFWANDDEDVAAVVDAASDDL